MKLIAGLITGVALAFAANAQTESPTDKGARLMKAAKDEGCWLPRR